MDGLTSRLRAASVVLNSVPVGQRAIATEFPRRLRFLQHALQKDEQLLLVVSTPLIEPASDRRTAGDTEFLQHRFAIGGRRQEPHALIVRRGNTHDQTKGFQFCHLATDRRMIFPCQMPQLHDTDRGMQTQS